MAIDIRCTPPTVQGMGMFLDPPLKMQGYADVYTETWKNRKDEIVMPIPRFVELLDEAGIDKVVMIAADKEVHIGSKFPNDTLAELGAHLGEGSAPDTAISQRLKDMYGQAGLSLSADATDSLKSLGLSAA